MRVGERAINSTISNMFFTARHPVTVCCSLLLNYISVGGKIILELNHIGISHLGTLVYFRGFRFIRWIGPNETPRQGLPFPGVHICSRPYYPLTIHLKDYDHGRDCFTRKSSYTLKNTFIVLVQHKKVAQGEGDMSKSKNQRTVPRSMRHKQVLDVAENEPDASLEAIADEVPSATPELVERVLEEYGDPADSPSASTPEGEGESNVHPTDFPDPDDLSEEQCEILELIRDHPESTQSELAEKLDVSHTTVSNRANSIDGFEWANRQTFVENVLENKPSQSPSEDSQMSVNGSESRETNTDLRQRVTAIEQQIEAVTDNEGGCTIFDDLDLTHKIVHACLESDSITEDDERKIVEGMLRY